MNATRLGMRRLLAIVGILAALLTGATPAHAHEAQDAFVLGWTPPTPIASGLQGAAEPALAYTPDGVLHAMWTAEGRLYYASQLPGQGWSSAKRLTSGESPALAVDASGQLHAVFANNFQNNWEIYHIRLLSNGWSLPNPVSRTLGQSVQPVLAANKAQGGLQAAWMELLGTTWTIYTGSWTGGFWSSYPVSNAIGKDPALAVLGDGAVTLAWQRRITPLDDPGGRYEVFVSERLQNGWSIPVDASDRPNKEGVDSTGVNALAGPDGRVHLAWQENERDVVYDFGRGMYWPAPVVIATANGVARGPQLALGTDGLLSLAWDEGEDIRVASAPAGSLNWPEPYTLRPPLGDQKDVTLIVTDVGLAVGWVQTGNDGVSTLYESRRRPLSGIDLAFKVRIPFLILTD